MSELGKGLFSGEKREQAEELFNTLSGDQLLWLGGFVSGINEYNRFLQELIEKRMPKGGDGKKEHKDGGTDVVTNPTKRLKVLYGSHSGNSKSIARWVEEEARRHAIDVEVVDMANYRPRGLKNEEQLLVVVSTHGEGEPPIAAEELHTFIHSKKAPKLDGVKYSIIALGDSSYKHFCKTGLDFHDQLQLLGGEPVSPVGKLDVDFKDVARDLIAKVVPLFNGGVVSETVDSDKKKSQATSDEIFQAEVLDRVQLNGRGSEKETWHIELSLENSGLTYEPGDALEVYVQNSNRLVADVLNKLEIEPTEVVEVGNDKISIEEALTHHFELTVVTPLVVKKYAELLGSDSLNKILDDRDQLGAFLYGTDFLDLLTEFPLVLTAGQLVGLLRKLPPRLYSISSSQEAYPDEVHLTVSAVRYNKNNRAHEGVASIYLVDRLEEDATLPIRIKKNEGFRLPKDDKAQIIMVGPGTGVAPFRAFVQERQALGVTARNWLFFGDQHFATDFLYQQEWLKYREQGVLSRLDVAFSRDQEEKVYVQDKMRVNARRLFMWLENGAYFYLCGDMKLMARDVKSALLEIIQNEGGFNEEEAKAYFTKLRKTGRFQEDVY